MFGFKSATLILMLALPVSGYAADSDHRFMAKGAGLASCDRFLVAANLKNTEYYNYGGWVEGFITAFNQLRPETFDVAPWQSADYLINIVEEYCKKNKEASFYQATAYVIKALDKNRLKKHTLLLTIKSGDKKMLIHKEILIQAQRALSEAGYYESNEFGDFNNKTEIALRKYQQNKSLNQTGLPDQATLINLFYSSQINAPMRPVTPSRR